jgi:hypothetical protein
VFSTESSYKLHKASEGLSSVRKPNPPVHVADGSIMETNDARKQVTELGSKLRVQVRDSLGQALKLRIDSTSLVRHIIEAYCNRYGTKENQKAVLYLDDESLDPDQTILISGLEDEDLVDIRLMPSIDENLPFPPPVAPPDSLADDSIISTPEAIGLALPSCNEIAEQTFNVRKIKLRIQDAQGNELKVLADVSKLIGTLVEAFCRKHCPEGTMIGYLLNPDGEKLDPSVPIDEAELEDGDKLEIWFS